MPHTGVFLSLLNTGLSCGNMEKVSFPHSHSVGWHIEGFQMLVDCAVRKVDPFILEHALYLSVTHMRIFFLCLLAGDLFSWGNEGSARSFLFLSYR